MGRIGDSSGFCLLLGFSQEEYEKQKIMNASILSRIQKREPQNIVLNVKAKNHSYENIVILKIHIPIFCQSKPAIINTIFPL